MSTVKDNGNFNLAAPFDKVRADAQNAIMTEMGLQRQNNPGMQ